jgi:transcription initiation factor TFIIIB Brf1 subunit/transcription initiation factor TFIIB
MDSYDEIWAIANEYFDGMKESSVSKSTNDNECKHINTMVDHQAGDVICIDCGCVVRKDTGTSIEWNNYKDDTGNFSKNTQRADVHTDSNPYSKGGTICGMFKNNNSLGAKLHLQQCFSHKQRTFWQTSQIYENICTKHGLPTDVLDCAKKLWHVCMESGKLTRASVREGLIASCLYYSCVENKHPTNRTDILLYFQCDSKTLTKGEKVFYSIVENNDRYRHLTKESIDVEENDSFVKYCSKLNLEWKVGIMCNDIFIKNKIHLNTVTPKSATCGVIVYVVKKKLKLKQPTKSELSTMLNVCTPTINKVVDILLENDT